MTPEKLKRMEAAGYVVGDIQDFLGLTPEEVQLIDLRIAVARAIKSAREKTGLTQAGLAKKIGSSQPRVAVAEAAGKGASLDLQFRCLFAAGGQLEASLPKVARKPGRSNKRKAPPAIGR